MTIAEESTNGAATAEVNQKPEASTQEAVPESGEMAGGDVDKRIEALKAELNQKYEKDFAALRSTKDRELHEMRQAHQQQLQAVQATVGDLGRQSLGEQEFNQVLQRNAPVDPRLWRRMKAGTIFEEGDQFNLSYEQKKQLIDDPNVNEHNWTAAARQLQIDSQLNEREKREKEREELLLSEIKALRKQIDGTKAEAAEEVRQVRKETGAESITTAAPQSQAPSAELRLEYEKQLNELESRKGDDRRTPYRELRAKFKGLGLQEEDMRTPRR